MGEYKDSDYYDNIYSNSAVYNNPNLQQSPYYDLWKKCISYTNKEDKIIDFGCGNGLFAKLCLLNGRNYIAAYDFSPVAIKKAKEMNPEIADKFFLADLTIPDIYKNTEYTACTFIEVLEHLEDDLAIFKNIPDYVKIILTVPSYDSAGHIRFFKNINEALDRYSKLLFINDYKTMLIENVSEVYVLNCIKK
jgi:2-polyprenyl-3-methyl-5-hydroxy-6-metoxy-1,4-benzoquinol methylase